MTYIQTGVNILGTVGLVVTIVWTLIQFFTSRKELVIDNKQLLIDTEQMYINKMASFREEISALTRRIASIEQQLQIREREILRSEGQRVSALLRVKELEDENSSLRNRVCMIPNCGLRVNMEKPDAK